MLVDIYVGLSNLLNGENSFFTWLKRLLHYTYIHFRSYPTTQSTDTTLAYHRQLKQKISKYFLNNNNNNNNNNTVRCFV